ncbi:MAG: MerR family transcriptional regulator [Candidatus Faecousia sp.]|nr:MerR family transcriptional regulator [Bacillota bacterium]MDY4220082.1 MerR family transcriptional regulator [Candidatus Faecousia sp.]
MKTVKEVSKLTGVSVRALHHYDAIGLLKPTRVTEAGYRLYDDTALARLQSILLFRELQFPLREIGEILDTPDFDPMSALEQQIRLLELRREHLDEVISHARQIQRTGVMNMDFSAFDETKLEAYAREARAKWGQTQAYKEFEEKTAGQTQARLQETGEALMDHFRRLGALRHMSPGAGEVQTLIGELRDFITRHYYTCTPQILRGLGQMYAAGGEMTENIDKAGGPGTAAFANAAIEIYCG